MESKEIEIRLGEKILLGNLAIDEKAKGIVLFAHGSGSGRFSPRNNFVALQMQKKGMATLLMDLLTKEEEAIDELTRELRFDVEMLGNRLVEVKKWLEKREETKHLSIGYFGASTGAAAALTPVQTPSRIATIADDPIRSSVLGILVTISPITGRCVRKDTPKLPVNILTMYLQNM